MNLYQCEETFRNLYKNKKVELSFDESCVRCYEVMCTDGDAHDMHHIEYKKVKVSVEGQDPIYIPIAPHRECIKWDDVKQRIASKCRKQQDA